MARARHDEALPKRGPRRRTKMRLQQPHPRGFCLLEVVLACFLTLLRQVRPSRKVPERCRAGADHQADDLVGSLPIKAMLAVKCGREAHSGVTLPNQHVPPGVFWTQDTAMRPP